MLNVADEDLKQVDEVLVRKIGALIESYVTRLKRGRFTHTVNEKPQESRSTVAAVEMAELLSTIVQLFEEHELCAGSQTMISLEASYPAMEVNSEHVSRLLVLLGRSGDALLRSQFGTLLLMNVLRRVITIIHDAAEQSKGEDAELEKEAKELLDEYREADDTSSANASSGPSEIDEPHHHDPTASSPKVKLPSSSRKKGEVEEEVGLSMGKSGMRGMRSVRFAELGDDLSAAATASAGNGGVASPLGAAAAQRALSFTGGLGGAGLLQRSGSIVASDIPGQQFLKRVPSRRDETPERGSGAVTYPVRLRDFYRHAIDGIEEFKVELESMTEELGRRAVKQLHSSDTVLTLGYSNTTKRYLLACANEGHHFKVIILEGAPFPSSATQGLANVLREHKVHVQVLPDSSAFAMMSMCTKVLVSAESVLANGGMLANVGTHPVCIAARHFSIPVMVATTTLKMSPYYPSDALCTRLVRIARFSTAQELPWSTYGSPETVLPQPFGVSTADGGRGFTVHAPVTEYVPPELITLYVTNESEYMPSQIHRIVRANYGDAD